MSKRIYDIGFVSFETHWTDPASGDRIIACVAGSGHTLYLINDTDNRIVAWANANAATPAYWYGLAYVAPYLYCNYQYTGGGAAPTKKIDLSGVNLQSAVPVDLTPVGYAYTSLGWTLQNGNAYRPLVAGTMGGYTILATVTDDYVELFDLATSTARYTPNFVARITFGERNVCAFVDGVFYYTAENYVLYVTAFPAANNFFPNGLAGTVADDFSVDSRLIGWDTWGTRSSPWSPDPALGSTTVTGGRMLLSITDPTTDSTYSYRFASRRMVAATPIDIEFELYCPAWVTDQRNEVDLYFGATQKRCYVEWLSGCWRCSFDGSGLTTVTAAATTLRLRFAYSDPTLTIQYKANGAANWTTLQTYNSAGLAGVYYTIIDTHGRYAGTYNLYINEITDGYAAGAYDGPPILQPGGSNALAVSANGDTPRVAFGTAAGAWQVVGDKSTPGSSEQNGSYVAPIAAAASVRAVAYNATGDRLAIGHSTGAIIYTVAGIEIIDITDKLPDPSVNVITYDGDTVLIIGTDDGLFVTDELSPLSGGSMFNSPFYGGFNEEFK